MKVSLFIASEFHLPSGKCSVGRDLSGGDVFIEPEQVKQIPCPSPEQWEEWMNHIFVSTKRIVRQSNADLPQANSENSAPEPESAVSTL